MLRPWRAGCCCAATRQFRFYGSLGHLQQLVAILDYFESLRCTFGFQTPGKNDRVNRTWRCMWSGRRNSNAMVMRRCIASSRSCGRFVACDKNGELWHSPAVPVPRGQLCTCGSMLSADSTFCHFISRRSAAAGLIAKPGHQVHRLLTMMMMPSCFSTSVSSRLTWCDPRSSLKQDTHRHCAERLHDGDSLQAEKRALRQLRGSRCEFKGVTSLCAHLSSKMDSHSSKNSSASWILASRKMKRMASPASLLPSDGKLISRTAASQETASASARKLFSHELHGWMFCQELQCKPGTLRHCIEQGSWRWKLQWQKLNARLFCARAPQRHCTSLSCRRPRVHGTKAPHRRRRLLQVHQHQRR